MSICNGKQIIDEGKKLNLLHPCRTPLFEALLSQPSSGNRPSATLTICELSLAFALSSRGLAQGLGLVHCTAHPLTAPAMKVSLQRTRALEVNTSLLVVTAMSR